MFKRLFGPGSAKQKEPDDTIYLFIRETIVKILPDGKTGNINAETRLDSLGFDSIMYIDLILSLETIVNKDLDEIVDEVDLSAIQTVGDVVQLVHRLR